MQPTQTSAAPLGATYSQHRTPGQSTPTTGATWQEFKTPEGKVYFFHPVTRQTVWEKPEVLQTPEERALAKTSWKSYKTANGRSYYYNPTTKQTVWERPQEVSDAISAAERAASTTTPTVSIPAPASKAVTPVTATTPAPLTSPVTADIPATKPSLTITSSVDVPSPDDLARVPLNTFTTEAQRTEAFHMLLRSVGAKSDWTWEQAMRATINHPHYRVLISVGSRKAAFESFLPLKREEERAAKRAKFQKLLARLFPDVAHLPMSFAEARAMWRNDPAARDSFMSTRRQEQQMYQAYSDQLVKDYETEQSRVHQAVRERLTQALNDCPEVTINTPWKDIRRLLEALPMYSEMAKSEAGVDPNDLLVVFEAHIERLQAEFDEWRTKQETVAYRKARKAREGFQALLEEYTAEHGLAYDATWTAFYPAIKDEPRYTELLGHPGSSPIELFWDKVELQREHISDLAQRAEQTLEKNGVEMTPDLSAVDFKAALGESLVEAGATARDIDQVYRKLHRRAERDEDYRQEKAKRRLIEKRDDLYYLLRDYRPRIALNIPYEE
ncbi:U1 snRNP protein, partial [Tieghemiomyces parasiticus]